ncbi:hypothetical protein ACM66B_000289 [Microbotryomycetes sp. NB124-2]
MSNTRDDVVQSSSPESWDAIAILEEAHEMYLIDWAGCDSQGQPFEPTWEPKQNASTALVKLWQKQKMEKLAKKRTAQAAPLVSERKAEIVDSDEEVQVRSSSVSPQKHMRPRKRSRATFTIRSDDENDSQVVQTSSSQQSVTAQEPKTRPGDADRSGNTSIVPDSQGAPTLNSQSATDAATQAEQSLTASNESRPQAKILDKASAEPEPEALVPATSSIVFKTQDPIEDPDSSPARFPLCPAAFRMAHRPPPVPPALPQCQTSAFTKPQLELVIELSKQAQSPSSSQSRMNDENSVSSHRSNSSSISGSSSQIIATGLGLGRQVNVALMRPASAASASSANVPQRSAAMIKAQERSRMRVVYDLDEDVGDGAVAAVDRRRVASAHAGTLSRTPARIMQAASGHGNVNEVPEGGSDGSYGRQPPQHNGGGSNYHGGYRQTSDPRGYSAAGQTYAQSSVAQYGGFGYSGGGSNGGHQAGGGPYESSHAAHGAPSSSKRPLSADERDPSLKKPKTNNDGHSPPVHHQQAPSGASPLPQPQYPPMYYPAYGYGYYPPPHQPVAYGYPMPVPPPPPQVAAPPPASRHDGLSPRQSSAPGPYPARSSDAPQRPAQNLQRELPVAPTPSFPPSLARVLGETTTPIDSAPNSGRGTPAKSRSASPPPRSGTSPALVAAAASAAAPTQTAPQPPQQSLQQQSLAQPTSAPASKTLAPITSRTASPAPQQSTSNNTELIALVQFSPYIDDEDGTKAEIGKFLTDPKAYSAGGSDLPLNKSAHWAFELRRTTHESIEKTDFIILHTTTGTFQLKRAARSQSQFDFARSLSHATSRGAAPRVTTPMVATPSVEVSAPVATPVAQMTREELEKEVETLRAQAAQLEALRSFQVEAAKLKADVASLQKQNRVLQSSRDSAQTDFAYMQQQYQAASTAAVARAQECQAAEAEVTKLKGMLDVGIKQRYLVHKGQVDRLELELAKVKTELFVAKAKDKRVYESGVLEKAAKWDSHVVSQQQRWSRIQAGEDSQTDEDSDEGGYDSDELVAQRWREIEAAEEAAARAKKLAEENKEEFACEWRHAVGAEPDAVGETKPCGQVLESREALREHLLEQHVPRTASAAVAGGDIQV